MMEDFIRSNLGNEYADFYKDATAEIQTRIDLDFIAVLANAKSNQPVSLEKETIISDGRLKVRYILEAEIDYKKNRK